MSLSGIPGFDDLKYEPWPPRKSPDVDPTDSMFDMIQRKDILLSLPYESFEPVVRLIEEAADDPDVLAIKIILYRTSRNSPIVAALQRASESGKHVTALVELKARFDEARNIDWAKSLEQAGVQVIYGVKGLKTHAKVCIIVRREAHGIQRYVHFGTGNYNEVTAKLYCDVGFLTCDEELAADATSFFNAITGYSVPQQYRKIAAAPFSLRDKLLEADRRRNRAPQTGPAGAHHGQGEFAVRPQADQGPVRASQAGVRIDLNVRGICCLRPGVPDLSEHIRVVSIVDRYLEHARIFYFYHGGAELVFISSADWMPRNLDKRVELLVPIEDAGQPPAADRRAQVVLPRQRQGPPAAGRRHVPAAAARQGRPQASSSGELVSLGVRSRKDARTIATHRVSTSSSCRKGRVVCLWPSSSNGWKPVRTNCWRTLRSAVWIRACSRSCTLCRWQPSIRNGTSNTSTRCASGHGGPRPPCRCTKDTLAQTPPEVDQLPN